METLSVAVAEAETTEINYPEWTEYRKKNGLDHTRAGIVRN